MCAPTAFSFSAGVSQGGSVVGFEGAFEDGLGALPNKVVRAHASGQLWGRCHFTAAGLAPGGRYAFRLRAHNAAGFGPFSPV